MSNLRNGSGLFANPSKAPIFSGEHYDKNLAPALFCDFTAEEAPFTLTGCSTSADGLVCGAGSKAVSEFGTAIDFQRATATFQMAAGASIGIGMGVTCAFFTGSTLGMARNYDGGTSAPTADASAQIPFSLAAGELYSITLEKKACTAIATLCRLKTNETASVTITGVTTLCLGAPFIVVFSGTNVLCKGLAYYAPLFEHARCLIVGDSITEGVTQEGATDVRAAWKLAQEYFHGNAVISGVGWATTSTCKARVDELLKMGYAFEMVIFCTGTNDGNAGYPATSFYQEIIDELTAMGIRVIWGVPPMRVNYESSDKMPRVRANILAATGCSFIRFDWATQDANGDPDAVCFSDGTHLTAAGYQRCYEFAARELEALGV